MGGGGRGADRNIALLYIFFKYNQQDATWL